MPLRSEWQIQREGFTVDGLTGIFRNTAFNPYLTLPLALLARFTRRGQELSHQHQKALKWLNVLIGLGIYQRAVKLLDEGVLNNWTSDTYDWKKELVVVTGGSDGIGAIVVKLLAEKGVRVAVVDIQPLTYEAVPNVNYFKIDLADPSSIESTCETIKSHLGNPTVLINNAGIASNSTITETSQKTLDLTFKVNTFSHYHLLRSFLPSMVQSNHGMVVTVASLAAHVTAPQMASYAGSKAAALAMHEALHAELATTYNAPKVRTVLMCQGYTKTKLFQGFGEGDGFVEYSLAPETVAEEIVRAVLSGRSKVLTLPRFSWFTAVQLRASNLWWQYGLRKGLVKLMKGFNGRAVAQAIKDGVETAAQKTQDGIEMARNGVDNAAQKTKDGFEAARQGIDNVKDRIAGTVDDLEKTGPEDSTVLV